MIHWGEHKPIKTDENEAEDITRGTHAMKDHKITGLKGYFAKKDEGIVAIQFQLAPPVSGQNMTNQTELPGII